VTIAVALRTDVRDEGWPASINSRARKSGARVAASIRRSG
jgi:hypothetical protein